MEAMEEETFNLEIDDNYILFKSSSGKYLTVTSDNTLKFESDNPSDETRFNVISQCSNGKIASMQSLWKLLFVVFRLWKRSCENSLILRILP